MEIRALLLVLAAGAGHQGDTGGRPGCGGGAQAGGQGGAVVKVWLRIPGIQVKRIRAGEVILSGGAINSPQLLLLSGIGPRKHLEEVRCTLVLRVPGV